MRIPYERARIVTRVSTSSTERGLNYIFARSNWYRRRPKATLLYCTLLCTRIAAIKIQNHLTWILKRIKRGPLARSLENHLPVKMRSRPGSLIRLPSRAY